MKCPKCGNIVLGKFCTNCGMHFPNNQSNSPEIQSNASLPSLNSPVRSQRLANPYNFVHWYNFDVGWALVLLIFSLFTWMLGMILLMLWLAFIGIIFGGVAIILAIKSDNPKKEGPKIITVFGIIILTTELVIFMLVFLLVLGLLVSIF